MGAGLRNRIPDYVLVAVGVWAAHSGKQPPGVRMVLAKTAVFDFVKVVRSKLRAGRSGDSLQQPTAQKQRPKGFPQSWIPFEFF